jgi:methionyl-tRNA synthetase
MSSFFLTTAIDYANGLPHLGHAYEKVLADAIARFHRNLGDDVFFLTGVDEHGQKVQQSAKDAGMEPLQYVNGLAEKFANAWERLGISNSRFVRTTDPLHKDVVRKFLQKLYDEGQIYFEEHEGFYSVRQEQFVTEKEMVDGKWPEIYGDVVRMKEPAYYYRLSAHQEWLRDHVRSHPEFIVPAFRRNDVLNFLEQPLGDLCISRPKSRLSWGIPLPFDEEYVTYVWFDALTNYASWAYLGTAESRWPADLHIIGKDILVPAHAIYWTGMLHGLGLPQPRAFLVHGWWQVMGAKMSKSTGNVVDPLSVIDKYGPDAFRYFVLRDMAVGQDADFTLDTFAQRYRSDLGNDLGNLFNRTISMVGRYRQGTVPHGTLNPEIAETIRQTTEEYRTRFARYEIHIALEKVWRLVARGNQFVDEQAPWKLAKDPALAGQLDDVLLTLAEIARVLTLLIEPAMPDIARRARAQLGLPTEGFALSDAQPGNGMAGVRTGSPEPLFPRIEEAPPAK